MLTLLLLVLFFGGFSGVLYLILGYWPNQQKKGWRAVMEQLGWKVTQLHASGLGLGLEVNGRHRGRKVSLRPERRRLSGSRTSVYLLRLELSKALPRDLTLKSESLGSKLLALLGSDDESVGDAELDSAFRLKYLTPQARAVLLFPPVRQRLLAMYRRFRSSDYVAHFTIENGQFEAEFHTSRLAPPKRVEEAVTLVLGLADALDDAARNAPGVGAGEPSAAPGAPSRR